MIQIYLLSVICPLVSGWMLYKDPDEPASFERVFSGAFPFRFASGVASLVTGVLVLLSPIEGDVRLVGDLVPAAACIASGLALIERQTAGGKDGEGFLAVVYEFLATHRKKVGLATIIAAALHFLLPKALFL